MHIKKLMYLFLCAPLCTLRPANAMVDWNSGTGIARLGVVAFFSTAVTTYGIRRWQARTNTILVKNKEIPRAVISGYTGLCFMAWAYNKPFEYPFMLIESAVYNTVNLPVLAAKCLYSSTESVAKAVGNSITTCNSHFLWGSTCAVVLGFGLYYCHQYKKTEKERKKIKDLEDELKAKTAAVNVYAYQLTATNQQHANLQRAYETLQGQMDQPGTPPHETS